MLVDKDSLLDVLNEISTHVDIGVDTETTGLTEDDSLFSLILATIDKSYYFNFLHYNDLDPKFILDREETFSLAQALVFAKRNATFYLHNAKFDMRMLAKEKITLYGDIHCTEAIERAIKNNYMGKKPYSLAACAARRGWQKDEAVEEYIKKHKLYTKINVPGKSKPEELKHFDKVPHQIIIPYGIKDGDLALRLGLDQKQKLRELEENKPDTFPSYTPLIQSEKKVTKAAFQMERAGILIDKSYVAEALDYEISNKNSALREYLSLTGEEFIDSNVALANVFTRLGESFPRTALGNPSFKADVLEKMTNPVADLVNKIRYHDKRAGTYYSSFLFYADKNGVIHPNARQAGTETGRFSYSNPNLQNVPKEDEEEDQHIPYHVRSSFIPRPGHFFYSIDWRQQEFRMMLDYAGEHALIAAINAGADVHEATAQLCGITRKQAKTINFGLLYGMGVEKLAAELKITVAEARALKFKYFAKLPKVKRFIDSVTRAGKARGYIFNWLGRRNYISSTEFAYILPNHLIQGGCADVCKKSMVQCAEMLVDKKANTRMLLQVHDELLFEVPFGEEDIVDPIVQIMESAYKSINGIKLEVSVEHALKSWGYRDKIQGRKVA